MTHLVLRQDPPANSTRAPSGHVESPEYLDIPDPILLVFLIAAALLGLAILTSLPRLVARIVSGRRSGELFKGVFFGDRGKRDSPVRQYSIGLEKRNVRSPRHFPAWSAILPGAHVLQREIPWTAGYTYGQGITMAIYAGLVGAAIAIRKWVKQAQGMTNSLQRSPLTEPEHVGQVAVFQLPGEQRFWVDRLTVVAVVLGIPLSPVATLLGVSTHQLTFLHKFVGRMML